jgi:hypothetical protein
VCKHVIGVAYNLGLCEFPGLDLNIEANTKRGRRKKAQMALVYRESTGPVNPSLQSMIAVGPTSLANSIGEISVQTSTTAIVPRKRGRPKKKLQSNETTSDFLNCAELVNQVPQLTSSIISITKKRGRPKKH